MHKLYLNEFKIIPIYTVGIYRRSIHIKCEAVLNLRLCRYAVIFNVIYGRERFPVERKKETFKFEHRRRSNESRCQLVLLLLPPLPLLGDGANKFQCDAITYQTSSYQQFYRYDKCARHHFYSIL